MSLISSSTRVGKRRHKADIIALEASAVLSGAKFFQGESSRAKDCGDVCSRQPPSNFPFRLLRGFWRATTIAALRRDVKLDADPAGLSTCPDRHRALHRVVMPRFREAVQ